MTACTLKRVHLWPQEWLDQGVEVQTHTHTHTHMLTASTVSFVLTFPHTNTQTNRRRCKGYTEQMGQTSGGHLKHTLHHFMAHTYTHIRLMLTAPWRSGAFGPGLARRDQLPPVSSSHHHRMRPEATGTYVEQHGHILPRRHDLTQLAFTPLSLIMFLYVCVCGRVWVV